jgi:hypothetical protein
LHHILPFTIKGKEELRGVARALTKISLHSRKKRLQKTRMKKGSENLVASYSQRESDGTFLSFRLKSHHSKVRKDKKGGDVYLSINAYCSYVGGCQVKWNENRG